jgi:hypothetical protein
MSRHPVQLDDLTANNLGVLKRINSVVLPTNYGEAWYKDSLNVGQLAKLGKSITEVQRAQIIC